MMLRLRADPPGEPNGVIKGSGVEAPEPAADDAPEGA